MDDTYKHLTVGELIEALKDCNPDYLVTNLNGSSTVQGVITTDNQGHKLEGVVFLDNAL